MKTGIIFLVAVLFSACTYSQTVTKITAEEAYAFLSDTTDRHYILIDGRTTDMFNAGHIKQAIQINAYKENADSLLQEYIVSDTLVIYCTSQNRSLRLIERLQALSYIGSVIYIGDGIRAWKEHGYSLDSE
ncbi:MAG: rhodanese-like domain-containing protein [Bacteroidales bacterium]